MLYSLLYIVVRNVLSRACGFSSACVLSWVIRCTVSSLRE